MCIVNRIGAFRTHRPNVKVTEHVYWNGPHRMVRTVYETPAGTLLTLSESVGFTTWFHERMFKSEDDYEALLFLIQDEQYEPCYDDFSRTQNAFGEDAIFRADLDLEPLQELISGIKFGTEAFCEEWLENRDEILHLYDAIVANRRKVYKIIAESPTLLTNYGGNVVPEVIGLDAFEKYYVPNYNEAADIMHKHGKMIGSHLDANCRLFADAVAKCDLDYIEAFTPAPDTDMTLAEARAAWPDKLLWLNFPSSLHLKTDVEVEQAAFDLLDEPDDTSGIIMGITEDMPEDRWQGSMTAIMDGLDRHYNERPEKYKH
jgi:hypothetical protein